MAVLWRIMARHYSLPNVKEMVPVELLAQPIAVIYVVSYKIL